ncbi:helix-turn-helix domain-containing protein [Treponema parvum]|uniref:helix-turn-helix domain-containing protein n=1 Tax=Treponema parvum TaxID=138851 RepID=UPI001AEBDA54|nr:helix-turn-helix transcriptional regulator [Treponema parvum]QTQ17160.1 helix-turn-helix transcriptional regulator [Treponema parvum]
MTLTEALKEQMKDETFREEYESLGPEYDLISSLIDARKLSHVTQKQLADATGIAQSDISKIENGSGNPTIKILKRLADGLGMNLKIEFIAKTKISM